MTSPGRRVEAALGTILLRSTRARLYDRLVDAVDGVDATTYPVLSGLDRAGPSTAAGLAELIGLDRTATTRYATRLESAGLVQRYDDPGDGRATRLVLTEAGERAIATMRAELGASFDDMLTDWPPQDADVFAALLERFADRLRRLPPAPVRHPRERAAPPSGAPPT